MYKMCIFTLIVLCIAGGALAQTTVYVDGSVAATGNGSQAAPFKTITEALALTDADLTILVAGGTYTDETPYTDILNDQTLIGSYDSSFTTSDPSVTPTIIDMGKRPQADQEGTFYIGSVTGWTIENLVIQNSTTGEGDDTENGGAIYVRKGSNGTMRGVTFFNCATKFERGSEGGPAREGGAVCVRDASTVAFEDCIFDSCTAVGRGGAVRMRSAGSGNNVTFHRCLFTNCGARTGGSVIDDGDGTSQVEIVNCIFANNGVDVAIPSGTAPSNYLIRVSDRRALIYNCTFVGNNNPAGYMFEIGDSSEDGAVKETVNCVFANNTVGSGGSGVAIFSYADDYDDATTLQNNLFFSNSGMDPLDPAGATIIDANGNIAGDPQFVDAANGDYHLKVGSPGEDAGQTSALVPDDFARTLRPVGSAYDIGALEGQGMNPKVRGVMATASSSVNADLGPENTVNESGLNPWSQHDTTPTNMWLSAVGQEPPVWIQYEFDIVHKLDEMWIWNSNTALEPIVGLGGLGVKTATIEHSTDGTTWTALVDVPEFGQGTGTDDYMPNTTVHFNGVAAKFVRITCTSSWGGGGQYGLSEVRFFSFPVQARDPDPHDGARGVALDATLSWQAGSEAAEHNVYFSDDEQSVIDGTAPAETVSEASYGPLSLDSGSTYYWRVDEVNNVNAIPIWEGDVWNFTTIEHLVVDDFEDYNDYSPDRIFETWKDGYGYSETEFGPGYCGNGTGATIGHATFPYAEQVIVHEDSQSMPFYYDNSGTGTNSCGQPINLYYSETTASIADLQVGGDWTKFKALSLWFRGDPGNSITEQMYVKVNGTMVTYDGDANDLAQTTWHEWLIDLTEFGVNGDVQDISIGLGEPGGTSPGGSGLVYFDDIRLYPSRCILSKRSANFAKADFAPAGDPAGDCIIDYREIEIIGRDWLFEDQIVAPTEDPGLTGILAYYPLNEGQGTTVFDLSGNNTDGMINYPNGGLGTGGSVWHTDSERGTVLSFSGDDSSGAYVSAGTIPALGLANNFTWAFWAKQDGGGTGANDVIIGNRDGGTQSPLQFIKFTPTNFEYYNADDSMSIDYADIPSGQWIHHTVVKSGTTLTYYRNSVDSGASTVTSPMDANPFLIGGDVTRERWRGWISEVRLYSRALSQAEIAYLADTTPGDGQLHFPVRSAAELYEAEPEGSQSVDLKDFAVLANVWLEQELWP